MRSPHSRRSRRRRRRPSTRPRRPHTSRCGEASRTRSTPTFADPHVPKRSHASTRGRRPQTISRASLRSTRSSPRNPTSPRRSSTDSSSTTGSSPGARARRTSSCTPSVTTTTPRSRVAFWPSACSPRTKIVSWRPPSACSRGTGRCSTASRLTSVVDRPRRESGFELNYLWRALRGPPTHPPLTDATIGASTFAAVAATADVLGISDNAATHGWWLAIFAALLFTILTALTGFIDWLRLPTGTPIWRTATAHMIAMLITSAVFLATLLVGKESFDAGNVESGPYLLTLIGFLLLTIGGWVGGGKLFYAPLAMPNTPSRANHCRVRP